ncbi:MAG: LVIVD repeat-containing protein [Candidatus Thorarchaeota archaeon]
MITVNLDPNIFPLPEQFQQTLSERDLRVPIAADIGPRTLSEPASEPAPVDEIPPPNSGTYVEDFTTTAYKDDSGTTTSGWGSGSIELPHRTPYLVGSYQNSHQQTVVVVRGDYAYVAEDLGLCTLNITDPTQPTLVGYCSLYGVPSSMVIDGNHAYVGLGSARLQVVDIIDPLNPSVVCTFDTPEEVEGMFISGNYLYLAEADSGLQIINVSDPVNPSVAATYATSDEANGVFVSGDYAYVAHGPSGLLVLNITDPIHPSFVSSCDTQRITHNLFVSGNYAYVVEGVWGLQIVNITDVVHPSLIGSYDEVGYSYNVFVSGDYAYVADGSGGLKILDVTNPAQPSLAGSCDTPGWAAGVWVDGEYCYVADHDGGMLVFRIADHADLSLVSTCLVSGTANGITVSGDYAYVAAGTTGLRIVNITDPLHPSLLGSYDTFGYAYDVFVSGDYAYVADGTWGLRVVNVTDPAHPTSVGYCSTPGYAYDVFVSGDYAYVADGPWGLRVVNVTDPAHPTSVGYYSSSYIVRSVFVDGNIAYIANENSNLYSVNVTDPTNPTFLDSCYTGGEAYDVYVSGDYAYVAAYSNGLKVVDVTDPTDLYEVGHYTTTTYANDLSVAGDYVYVTGWQSGLRVFNVTDPTHPTPAGSTSGTDSAYGVFISGDYAYVAYSGNGMRVFEVQRNLCRQYQSSAAATSLPVDGGTIGIVWSATLTRSSATPSGTLIMYELSADNGIHWESVTAGQVHEFTTTGTILRWRTILITTDSVETPTISELTVSYKTKLAAPSLLTPSDTSTTNQTPTFDWSTVTGAAEYLLQLDTSPSFDTADLRNVSVAGPPYSIVDPFLVGVWYWRVAANDSSGDLGYFSTTRSIDVQDDIPPTWDETPTDQTIVENTPLRYDLNASDFSGIDTYWLNDVGHFTIDSQGVMTNNTPLSIRTYNIQVWVNDTQGNVATAQFYVIVLDITPPAWVGTPGDRVAEFGFPFLYELRVSDPSGIHRWWLNDTVHFSIDSLGLVTNNTPLDIGVYGLQVWVNDTAGNTATAEFSITVLDTRPPEWVVEPTDQVVEAGDPFSYELTATDPSGIDHWWINDTVHFTISSTGLVTNITALEAGEYSIEVRVYDPYGHYSSAVITITVEAATTLTPPPPMYDYLPFVVVGVLVGVLIIVVFVRRRNTSG